MEKSKRRISFKINENVRKLTITGEDKDNQVVMREELTDDELDLVNGGVSSNEQCHFLDCDKKDLQGYSMEEENEDFFNAGFMGMCSAFDQQNNPVQRVIDEEDDMMDVNREDCFAFGFMSMCSGYEQQASLIQNQENRAQDDNNQASIVEDCITYGFSGMCSGYELGQ